MKQFDSQKRHFVVMLKLIHPAHRTVMKEPAFIGYALWISIGCHASYPIWWWQAAFPMHMQSVICHFRVLMRRIRYEESYIQTDGRCNIHIRQPYVQRFFCIDFKSETQVELNGKRSILWISLYLPHYFRKARGVQDAIWFRATHLLWLFELSHRWFSSVPQNKSVP